MNLIPREFRPYVKSSLVSFGVGVGFTVTVAGALIGCFGSRKSTRQIPKGIIHVQASFHNTIVTVTDVRGQVVSWSSAGTCGFRGRRRGTPFAAQTIAGNTISTVVDQGMKRANVMIKGPGLGRDASLRDVHRNSILLTFIRDVTPLQHNGCRPSKRRRV